MSIEKPKNFDEELNFKFSITFNDYYCNIKNIKHNVDTIGKIKKKNFAKKEQFPLRKK